MARVDVFSESRSLGLVARDGIEPPTPAFSGLTSPAPIFSIPFALSPLHPLQTTRLLEQ
jgi:hypothetical protein